MTFHIVDGPTLLARIKSCSAQNEMMSFAVAYWGNGVIEAMGLKKSHNLLIICNLDHGGTNPKVIRELLKMGAEVKMHPRLHAKIGYMDNLSFLGSSNMSESGFGIQKHRSHEEANILFNYVNNGIKQRFEELWCNAKEVDEECLIRAEAAWKMSRRARAKIRVQVSQKSILELLADDPNTFDDAGLMVVTYKPCKPSEKRQIDDKRKAVRLAFGGQFDAYFDWDELPKDAYLFDFEEVKTEKFVWSGIYRRSPDIPDTTGFQVAQRVVDVLGSKVGQGGPLKLKRAMRLASEAGKLPIANSGGTRCFPVSVIAPYLFIPG